MALSRLVAIRVFVFSGKHHSLRISTPPRTVKLALVKLTIKTLKFPYFSHLDRERKKSVQNLIFVSFDT